MKEAKAAHVHAQANAKVQMKTLQADEKAHDASADANMKAKEKTSDALHDGNKDKRAADYAVAKEKCDTYSGDTKEHCIDRAKVQFGK